LIQKPRNKIFFGWWTVLATSLLTGIAYGFYQFGISVIFKPLAMELGLNRAETSAAASFARLEGGFEAPLTGWLIDKFGTKWVIFTGVFLLGLGLILMTFIQQQWQYYVVWGFVVATGVNTAITLPIDKTLTNWFVKKRGLAMGIKNAFIGGGGILVLPFVTWMTINHGWRMVCTTWGILVFASLLLVVFLIKPKRPEYYGLLPDGAKLDDNANPDITASNLIDKGIKYASEVQEAEFTLRQAMRTRAYWMLLLAMACQGMTQGTITLHMIPFLTDTGIDPVVAAGMMSIMVFFTIPSRFFGGWIVDYVKKDHLQYLLAACFALVALGIGAFLVKPGIATIYLFLICFGIGSSAPTSLNLLIRGRFFGRKAYGSIAGISSLITMPFGIAAPIYAGWIYDTTGSYTTAFTTFACLATFAALIASFVRAPKPPEQVSDASKFM
jgi:MFS family permease